MNHEKLGYCLSIELVGSRSFCLMKMWTMLLNDWVQ